jgi:DNA-binding response OmpR family regulator
MKTLLVQDAGQDTTLSQCLRDRGDEVIACRDVRQGLDEASRHEFLLVVVDLQSRSEGEAFCERLRTCPNSNGRFVLFGMEPEPGEAHVRVLRAGADDVLCKPYEPRDVQVKLAVVEHAIQSRAEWQRKIDRLNTHAQQQVAIAALGQCALSEDLPTLVEVAGRFIIDTLDVDLWSLAELCADGKSLRLLAGFWVA